MSCTGVGGCVNYYYNALGNTFRESIAASAEGGAVGCVWGGETPPLRPTDADVDIDIVDADVEIDGDVVADGDADIDVDGDSEIDGDVGSDGDVDGDVDADSDADIDVDGDSEIDGDVGSDGDVDGDIDADSDIDVEDGDIEEDADVEEDADIDEETPIICDTPPGAAGLTAPTNGAMDVSTLPTFNLADAIDPDTATGDRIESYFIEISRASDFGAATTVRIDIGLVNPYTLQPGDITDAIGLVGERLLNGMEYFWRARAVDSCGLETPALAAGYSSFTTAEFCHADPTAAAPAMPLDGALAQPIPVDVVFNQSTDPDVGDSRAYTILIGTAVDALGNIIDPTEVSVPDSAVPADPAASVTYTVIPADYDFAFETLHYWAVATTDSCGNRVVSDAVSFTTEAHCSHPPEAGTVSFGGPSGDGISVNGTDVTFSLTLPLELDRLRGDVTHVVLEIDTVDTFDSGAAGVALISFDAGENAASFELPLGTVFEYNTHYYYRYYLYDNCGLGFYTDAAGIPNGEFTTERECMTDSFEDTTFSAPTHSSVEVNRLGALVLTRDESAWACFDFSSDYPDALGWTENATSGWTIRDNTAGSLRLSTIGLDSYGRFEIDPDWDADAGWGGNWMLRAVAQLVSTEGTSGATIRIKDGSHGIDFRLQPAMIIENYTGERFAMDPAADFYEYLIAANNPDYSIFVGGTERISGTLRVAADPQSVWFGDLAGVNDGDVRWREICWYPNNVLPYNGSGTYTTVIIDGTGNFESWGALSWVPVTPADSSITMRFCSSDNSDMSAARCLPGLTTHLGEDIPADHTGRYAQVQATLNATSDQISTPQLLGITLGWLTCE
ncbi:MAG: hypothetical protein ABIH69_02050 [bacterium]